MELIGFEQLPVRSEFDLSGEFSKQPFCLRGEVAEKLYRSSDELKASFQGGALTEAELNEFIARYSAEHITRNNVDNFGFPGSKTVSFELPTESGVIYDETSCSQTSFASIAKFGDWFTLGHIEWTGGYSIAKVISGSQMRIITGEVEAGVNLTKLSTYYSLCEFKLSSKNCFYHTAEVNDVIIHPSFAAHAVKFGHLSRDSSRLAKNLTM